MVKQTHTVTELFIRAVLRVGAWVIGWYVLFLLYIALLTIPFLFPPLVFGVYALYVLAIFVLIKAYKRGYTALETAPSLPPVRHASLLVAAFLVSFIVGDTLNWAYFEYLYPLTEYDQSVESGGISYLFITQYGLLLGAIFFLAHRKALTKHS